MSLKDRATRWFVRNIVRPRLQKIDESGYIRTDASIGETGEEIRNVFIPETVFAEIETRSDTNHRDEDVDKVYSAGKRFGWRFAQANDMPSKDKNSRKEIRKYINFFIGYVEKAYAHKLKQKLDIQNEYHELKAKDYIIYRKNDRGYLFAAGTTSGILSYIFSNPEIETHISECESRKYKCCKITTGKVDDLPGEPVGRLPDVDEGLPRKEYFKMNKIRELENAASFKQLQKEGKFDFDGNVMEHNGFTHIAEGCALFSILEQELSEIDAQGLLYNSAYDEGSKLAEDKDFSDVEDYLSAVGWGGIQISENGNKVEVECFPWNYLTEESEYLIFRGLLGGMISKVKGEETHFDNFETENSAECLDLTLKSEIQS